MTPTNEQQAIISRCCEPPRTRVAFEMCGIIHIPLTKGKVGYCDIEDLPTVHRQKLWFAHASRNTHYVTAKRHNTHVKLHRLIMQPGPALEVDHIDRNGLNNCRNNLRVVTQIDNAQNKSLYRNNKSGCPGVHYKSTGRGRKRWVAWIRIYNQKMFIGNYLTKEEAIAARTAKELEFRGNNPNI